MKSSTCPIKVLTFIEQFHQTVFMDIQICFYSHSFLILIIFVKNKKENQITSREKLLAAAQAFSNHKDIQILNSVWNEELPV